MQECTAQDVRRRLRQSINIGLPAAQTRRQQEGDKGHDLLTVALIATKPAAPSLSETRLLCTFLVTSRSFNFCQPPSWTSFGRLCA